MSKFATLDEIKHAHTILLKDKPFFEQDKIDIIECNETKDIKACPGSGKTTTLLAKLIILANQMPLENNQGICVLTHTNVAIDEIKSKLGNKADILFKYPNHFGTIQSFVDKFLAIPFFALRYNKRPMQISDDVFIKCFRRSFIVKLSQIKNSNLILYNHTYSFFQNNEKLYSKIRLAIIENKFELVNIEFDSIVEIKKPIRIKGLEWTLEEKKEIKELIIEIIKNVYNFYSVFSYYDAYTLAKGYYLTMNKLRESLSSRFKYLFLDEMQDTDALQKETIENVFNKLKTIVQRFGDHNQAIYNKVSDIEVWEPVNPLEINGSKRFGETIAKVLRTVCIEDNKKLKANDDIISINPILIVFDNPKDVLSKYCELINTKKIGEKTVWEFAKEEKNKDSKKMNNIKAIGWVGKPNNEYNIKSYFSEFNGFAKKEKVNYDSFKTFLRKQNKANVKDYSNKIIEALLHILSTANIKYSVGRVSRTFTKTTLLQEFARRDEEKANQLRFNLVKWARDIHNSNAFNDETISEIRSYIRIIFCPLFGVNVENKYVESFIDSNETEDISEDEIKKNNLFISNGVEVEIGTIHSVKGETHIATLYLETSYYKKHESERILNQMKGIVYKTKKSDTYIKETLKMAYVGMSRPKYMLCYAIHRSRYDDALNIENRGMWEVVKTY